MSAKALSEDPGIPELDRVSLADQYCEQAVILLRRVLAGEGYDSKPRARKELLDQEDYAELRERADFQQLLQQSGTDEDRR